VTEETGPNPMNTAFEIVTLLPGVTSLRKRSGELDGNLPVRAARYCGPVFEGSAAGFQITLAQPMTLARTRRGNTECVMTDPTLKQVSEEVDGALERAVRHGLMARGDYWHRLFRGNALPTRGQRLLFWSGHMVRPRPGIWLLIGGAFNRRSRVSVIDHLVTDPTRFVPLVVEIDIRDLTREPRWLEMEIGCAVALRPTTRVRKQPLTDGAPELREFAAFFSEAYFETKSKHPTASYVVRQRERAKRGAKAAVRCDARLLTIGPDVHEVTSFSRFITASGFSAVAASPGTVDVAIVKNIAPAKWTWQGQTHSHFEVRKRHLSALRSIWHKTIGDGQPSGLEFLEGHLMGEAWDQPYVQLQPWAFMPTAEGWSTLVDGFHQYPGYDGMRAVIATDWFSSLAMVYRLYGSTSVRIRYRAPMLRAIPVHRPTLELGVTQASL
jgi:hypothetical protein